MAGLSISITCLIFVTTYKHRLLVIYSSSGDRTFVIQGENVVIHLKRAFVRNTTHFPGKPGWQRTLVHSTNLTFACLILHDTTF